VKPSEDYDGFIIECTGRMIYANGNILGIDSDGGIFEGHDGGLDKDFTKEEREEIGNYMISLWEKWKNCP
jgi:hypothetical protein